MKQSDVTPCLLSNTAMGVLSFAAEKRSLFKRAVKPIIETHTGLTYVDALSFYESKTGKMDLIERMIEAARLVVVDISEPNPNVFQELGIAYALRKPILLLCSQRSWEQEWKERPPFDMQGRELLIFEDETDLKVQLGQHLPDCLFSTRDVTRSWDSNNALNHSNSCSELELISGETWSATAVHSSFVISYNVSILDSPARPDVRLSVSPTPGGYPRVLVIYPWEESPDECHIDYLKAEGDAHGASCRLRQIKVAIEPHQSFDVSVSLCWPNFVVESTVFKKADRLYVSLADLRTKGYPLHYAQHIGSSSNCRVKIEEIRIKEVYM